MITRLPSPSKGANRIFLVPGRTKALGEHMTNKRRIHLGLVLGEDPISVAARSPEFSPPEKASELGRIGGRRKRLSPGENVDPLPKLKSVVAVRDVVAQLIADVYAGKMNPRTAANLAPLLNLQMRAIESTDLERRVARVEELLAKTDKESDSTIGSRGDAPAKPNGNWKDPVVSRP